MEYAADIAGMSSDRVGAGIDHRMAPLRLNPNGDFKELVDAFGPGNDSDPGQQQRITNTANPPWNREPMESAIIQSRHSQDSRHCWKVNTKQDSVPAFCSLMDATSGGDDLRIYPLKKKYDGGDDAQHNCDEQPAFRPIQRTGGQEQKQGDE